MFPFFQALCYPEAAVPESNVNPTNDTPSFITVESFFVRYRNALAVKADFHPFYVDYYLHWMDQGVRYPPTLDQLLKDALAAVILHAATRPWKEDHAWTLNLQDPLINLFVTASNFGERAIGRIFTEGVKDSGQNLFYSQVSVRNEEPRISMVPYTGDSLFAAVEEFYRRSEQRPARFFEVADEEFLFISAQPDCDEEWLANLDPGAARRLDDEEELSLLEARRYRFHCGCTLEKVFPALAPLAKQGLDELFQGDESIGVTCPRCATQWRLTREQIEAVMDEHPAR